MGDSEGLEVCSYPEDERYEPRQKPGDVETRKIKDGMRWHTHPLAEIHCVGKRNPAHDNTRGDLGLCGNISSAYLVHWPDFTTSKLNFIRNKEGDVLDIFSLSPSL